MGEFPYWGTTDNNGNLQSSWVYAGGPGPQSSLAGFNTTYSYDGVNRLTGASENNGNTWSRNFSYDAYGNMSVTNNSGVSLNGLAPYSGGGANPYNSANNRLVSGNYDAAGNLVGIGTLASWFDGENRLTRTYDTSLQVGVNYQYDADGHRVLKTVDNGATTAYIYDAFGTLAAEYFNGGGTPPCQTCYFTYDHLGSVRMVTDAGANAIGRHDYLPFGEEIPSGTSLNRNAQWGAFDSARQRFTGQERDNDTRATPQLDYFGARYDGSALGRFTSPDHPLIDQHPDNPQTWNLYSYVWNNPLANIDPTGMSCVNTNNGSADDGDGKGCADAGVKPGDPNNPETTNQGQVNAQATAKNPSDLEYLWTILTHEIPQYDPKDVPLNDYARQIFTRVGRMLPTACGGGAYVYAGKEFDGGQVNGFAGGITEFDSREGVSKGALFEGGAAEGVVGGGGYVATTNSKGQVSTSGLGYLGGGAHAGVAGGSAGGVVFANGAGVYAEGSLFGRAAGVGAYVNITTNGGCDSGQR